MESKCSVCNIHFAAACEGSHSDVMLHGERNVDKLTMTAVSACVTFPIGAHVAALLKIGAAKTVNMRTISIPQCIEALIYYMAKNSHDQFISNLSG
jgi:hypothetical protein